MPIIDKSKPVLVTGGSGYLASWIIKMLLEAVKKTDVVKRVMLTSSVAAIFSDNVDIALAPEGIFNRYSMTVCWAELLMKRIIRLLSSIKKKERGGLYPARPRRLQPPCRSTKICRFYLQPISSFYLPR